MSLLLASQYPANRLSTSVDNEMLSQRLRSSGHAVLRTVSPGTWAVEGSSIFGSIALPHLRRKASNSWSAVQESYVSTKQVFESRWVVCTIGTSIASILTAWAGYSLHQHRRSQIEKRLQSIEEALQSGLEGGAWYTNRKFRREQLKLMGQMKPQRWQFLRRQFVRFRNSQPVHRIQESPPVADAGSLTAQQLHKS